MTDKMRCPNCLSIRDRIVGAEKQFCPNCGEEMQEFKEDPEKSAKKCSNPKKDIIHDTLVQPDDFYCQACGYALAQ